MDKNSTVATLFVFPFIPNVSCYTLQTAMCCYLKQNVLFIHLNTFKTLHHFTREHSISPTLNIILLSKDGSVYFLKSDLVQYTSTYIVVICACLQLCAKTLQTEQTSTYCCT